MPVTAEMASDPSKTPEACACWPHGREGRASEDETDSIGPGGCCCWRPVIVPTAPPRFHSAVGDLVRRPPLIPVFGASLQQMPHPTRSSASGDPLASAGPSDDTPSFEHDVVEDIARLDKEVLVVGADLEVLAGRRVAVGHTHQTTAYRARCLRERRRHGRRQLCYSTMRAGKYTPGSSSYNSRTCHQGQAGTRCTEPARVVSISGNIAGEPLRRTYLPLPAMSARDRGSLSRNCLLDRWSRRLR